LTERLIRSLLGGFELKIHKIEGRAKHPDSANLKVLDKGYRRPAKQLTDRIGVRVITYYPTEVDEVVRQLRSELEVDRRRSSDRRQTLGPRKFGYRSVHLISRLKRGYPKNTEYSSLVGMWFEIQVRSILEHAWAQIDHEVVFKSKIDYPNSVIRKFAAIAANLEILGDQFVSLKDERNKLIRRYRADYGQQLHWQKRFDVARLLGFLEWEYPRNPSWRETERAGKPFPARIEVTCLVALKACGLNTPRMLHAHMQTQRYQNAVKTFAANQGMSLDEVSHLGLTVVAIALKNISLFRDFFYDMSQDPAILEVTPRYRR